MNELHKNNKDSICFSNANIVDGTGVPQYVGNVLINNGFIEAVSPEAIESADQYVDCEGKYLAPGFVDAHSHMDFYAATQNPEYFRSFTQQGITTFVGGNCGFSPCTAHVDTVHDALLEETLFEVPNGKEVVCAGLAPFQRKLDGSEIQHNFYEMVGHGSYRTSISGFENRKLNQAELDDMLGQLELALQDGALGVSLGLQYKPGVFVGRDELVSVAQLVKRYDRILAVHAKAYSCLSGTYPLNPFGKPHNLRALEDMISIAEETGVRLQFSHLIFVGRKTWKTMDKALALIDKARSRGVDICFDMFPYACGATLLNTLLPEWFMAGMPGVASSMWAKAYLKFEFFLGKKLVGFDYGDMQISYAASEKYQGQEGKTVSEIARDFNQSSSETMVDILLQSQSLARGIFHTYYGPGQIETLMSHEACIFSTDAWPELHGTQNPAAFGSFPRFLEIARNSGNISIEQCVRNMTSKAAERFKLEGRGVIKPGACADLVIFDLDEIADNTQGGNNASAPSGISAVYINGVQHM